MRFHLNFMINPYFQITLFLAFMICFGYYCKGVFGWGEKKGKGESFSSCMCYFDYWMNKALNLVLFIFWVFWFCMF